ncbi:chorion class CA protein ERA.4-like [Bombyx mandarina]|uniref:Chorion class CA protein ERA.4-like n=1 Tax=Bombyx mandarina TaxID=7092 RepID=A0A6J2JI18_BOMMA|nr:chorion class CA protein ERA.4-like [Bombyx mandarina]
MNTSFVFLLCLQTCLIASIYGQCTGRGGYGGLGYSGLGGGSCGSCGGCSGYGGVGVGNMGVSGEIPVVGTATITSKVPIVGSFRFGGTACAPGSVSILGRCTPPCGCGRCSSS